MMTEKLNNGSRLRSQLASDYAQKAPPDAAPPDLAQVLQQLIEQAHQKNYLPITKMLLSSEKLARAPGHSDPTQPDYIVAQIRDEIREAVADIKAALRDRATEHMAKENQVQENRLCAIRFAAHDAAQGLDLLLESKGNLVGLRDGILIVDECDAEMLRRRGLSFESYCPRTNDADEIYRHYGLPSEAERIHSRRPTPLWRKLLKYVGG